MFHKQKKTPILTLIAIMSMLCVVVAALGIAFIAYVVRPHIIDSLGANGRSAGDSQSLVSIMRILAGFEGERTYLVLLQNDHELRPSGGFIGQYAIARLRNGEIVEFFTQDAGVLDTQAPVGVQVPRAPQPLVTYLNQNFMFFRDANWEPNFNQAAPHIVRTYAIERGPHADRIDGVIAVDTHVLVALLDILGPIEVGGTTYSSETIVDTLEYEVEVAYIDKGIHKNSRKDIIEEMGKQLINRAHKVSPLSYPSIINAAERLADEKHIVLFDYNDRLQTWYRDRGWDGSEYYDDEHVVQVIDSNLNAFKTDRVLRRSMHHSIVQSGVDLESKLTLTYTHVAKERDYRTREYRTYTRVRIPKNARNIALSGARTYDQHGNEGYDVSATSAYIELGMFFTVNLDSTQSIDITYNVPRPTQPTYTVEIVKQPGTPAPQLTLEYAFDTTITNVSGLSGARIYGTQFVFNGDLRTDRAFAIHF